MNATNQQDLQVSDRSGCFPANASARLDGWKEIAVYLNRSVRCAQRWEKSMSLPIRRIRHIEGGYTVYAYVAELESWRQSRERTVVRMLEENAVMGDAALPAPVDTLPSRRWSIPLRNLYRLFRKAVPARATRS
jgi:hypothetical protein